MSKTRLNSVTGVQTCALTIFKVALLEFMKL
jgi:hypothetical protein